MLPLISIPGFAPDGHNRVVISIMMPIILLFMTQYCANSDRGFLEFQQDTTVVAGKYLLASHYAAELL